ncbi:MAG: adenylyltransferase/cytidyltransferase family protein [Candidatus Bathyarchaeia archaeon]
MVQKVVLASGFFDPPHRGHIAYLRAAKKLGDWLVVSIHRDECCVRKKGYCFMPLEDRLAIIEALKYVDEVFVCRVSCDLTTCDALRIIKPQIFAKGGDRTPENMPRSEVELCERLGIKIVYGVGGGKVQSSSWLVKNFEKALNR